MGDRVDGFWAWFVAHEQQVRDAYDHQNTKWLDTELSPRVRGIGPRHELGDWAVFFAG